MSKNTLLSNNCIIMTFIVSSHGICFGLPSKNTLNPFSNVRKNDFFIGLSRFIMTPYCIMWLFMWFKRIRISHSRCSLITKRKECVLDVTIVHFPNWENKSEYQNLIKIEPKLDNSLSWSLWKYLWFNFDIWVV